MPTTLSIPVSPFSPEADTDRTQITTADTGFHSANAATTLVPNVPAITSTPAVAPTPEFLALQALPALVAALTQAAVSQPRQRQNNNRHTHRNNNRDTNVPEKSYCWTHSLFTNRGHTSRTCHNRERGHKLESTEKERMGGSDHPF